MLISSVQDGAHSGITPGPDAPHAPQASDAVWGDSAALPLRASVLATWVTISSPMPGTLFGTGLDARQIFDSPMTSMG